MRRLPRATKIVATVGPACDGRERLRRVIEAGANVLRFNLSHGDHDTHRRGIRAARQAARDSGHGVALLADLSGPKIRIRSRRGDESIELLDGSEVLLRGGSSPTTPSEICIDAPKILQDLRVGSTVLLSDGRLELLVVATGGEGLRCEVVRGGTLRARAGVNVPGGELSLRAPTRRDLRDATFAVEAGIDIFALSFVQAAADVDRLRRHLKRLGAGDTPIVAKIEKPAALEHLDEILVAADGVMVARGDLGVELSLEKVPIEQKRILARARAAGVFSITATEMLESMIERPAPTRAEVSDIANAIFDQSGAVMLSGETSIGQHPVRAVAMLARIASEADRCATHPDPPTPIGELATTGATTDALAAAAAQLAEATGARAIICFTDSGRTARILARHRPVAEILALSRSERTCRQLSLLWNTRARQIRRAPRVEKQMERGIEIARDLGVVADGDRVVLISGTSRDPNAENWLRLVEV